MYMVNGSFICDTNPGPHSQFSINIQLRKYIGRQPMKTVGLIQTTLLIIIDYSIILYEEHLISYERCKKKVPYSPLIFFLIVTVQIIIQARITWHLENSHHLASHPSAGLHSPGTLRGRTGGPR